TSSPIPPNTHANILPYTTLFRSGPKRAKPLNVDELTIKDLEAAVLDTRSNADRIYKDIFDEFSYLGDTNRNKNIFINTIGIRAEIGRAHVLTPVTFRTRMPSSA